MDHGFIDSSWKTILKLALRNTKITYYLKISPTTIYTQLVTDSLNLHHTWLRTCRGCSQQRWELKTALCLFVKAHTKQVSSFSLSLSIFFRTESSEGWDSFLWLYNAFLPLNMLVQIVHWNIHIASPGWAIFLWQLKLFLFFK